MSILEETQERIFIENHEREALSFRDNGPMAKLGRLNKQIDALKTKRNAALKELRASCEHVHISESDGGGRPWRICVDCGAEEEGWHCGWHVLIVGDGTTYTGSLSRCPGDHRKQIAGIVSRTSDWTKYRKDGGLYGVGQSHYNFHGGGIKTYQQLTEL